MEVLFKKHIKMQWSMAQWLGPAKPTMEGYFGKFESSLTRRPVNKYSSSNINNFLVLVLRDRRLFQTKTLIKTVFMLSLAQVLELSPRFWSKQNNQQQTYFQHHYHDQITSHQLKEQIQAMCHQYSYLVFAIFLYSQKNALLQTASISSFHLAIKVFILL